MPGISGIELSQKLKEINPQIRIMILTAFDNYLDYAMKIQVFRYLSKPIDRNRFIRNLEEAVEEYYKTNKKLTLKSNDSFIVVNTNDILYIGVNDTEIDLFEGQYIIPNGISYNSYIIYDEKIAIMDCVDKREEAQWLANLTEALADKTPDYLIVHHMEPDHSASIDDFIKKWCDFVNFSQINVDIFAY